MTDELVEVKRKNIKSATVLKALKSIEALRGIVTPHDVVEEARGEDHPLHDVFLWNNDEAGHRYRLIQARMLINSIKVEFQGERREAYLNVTTQVKSVTTKGYVSIERVLSDEDMHRQVVAQAVHEIEYWQHKYNSLNELRGVVDPSKMEEVKKSLE